MHPNPIYRTASREQNLSFAAETGFATFMLSSEDGAPLAAQAPFVIIENRIELHLMRSNPVARALKDGPRPARAVITGPHGYVSPDWYGLPDQVPTWNYVSVHVTGALALRPAAEMPGLLDRLSETYEARLAPKPAWTSDKVNPDQMDRLMRSILPLRMEIGTVEGTWKLAQNKTEAARLRAAAGLEAGLEAGHGMRGAGAELPQLAAMMRKLPVR